MAKRKRLIPEYNTVTLNGVEYYRTRIEDADGKRVALYARTPEELYDKEQEALAQIGHARFHRKSPTVSAPVIKCKKTPRKKCRFMAEEAKKR